MVDKGACPLVVSFGKGAGPEFCAILRHNNFDASLVVFESNILDPTEHTCTRLCMSGHAQLKDLVSAVSFSLMPYSRYFSRGLIVMEVL